MTDAFRSSYWKTSNSFSDGSSNIWFNNAVSTMSNAGFIKGYMDGTFGGDQPITRAEFVVIAARANGADGKYTGTEKFTDISGNWAALEKSWSAVNSAKQSSFSYQQSGGRWTDMPPL